MLMSRGQGNETGTERNIGPRCGNRIYAVLITPHHAKYFAHDLTRQAMNGMDRMSMPLFDAAVDLNPHHEESR